MAALLPPEPPSSIPKLDKRTLPPPMRQAIVDLHAEYPERHVDEIERILWGRLAAKRIPNLFLLFALADYAQGV